MADRPVPQVNGSLSLCKSNQDQSAFYSCLMRALTETVPKPSLDECNHFFLVAPECSFRLPAQPLDDDAEPPEEDEVRAVLPVPSEKYDFYLTAYGGGLSTPGSSFLPDAEEDKKEKPTQKETTAQLQSSKPSNKRHKKEVEDDKKKGTETPVKKQTPARK